MKKVAIVLVLLFATSVFAQGLAFGVKGGINYATLSGDDVGDVEWKLGLVAGAVAAFDVMDMLVIQGEVLYSMKGADSADASLGLTYIEIPVLLKYNVPMAGMVSPNLFIGPSLGILLSADADGEDVKEFFKGTDFGVVIGAGVDFDLGTGKVTLDARYNLGLTSLDDTDDADVKNSGISVMVGYLFGI